MTGAAITPSHLTPAQQSFLLELRRVRLAFQAPRGWRLKGDLTLHAHSLGEAMLTHRLAELVPGHGSAQLRINAAGIDLAQQILTNRRKARKGGQAA